MLFFLTITSTCWAWSGNMVSSLLLGLTRGSTDLGLAIPGLARSHLRPDCRCSRICDLDRGPLFRHVNPAAAGVGRSTTQAVVVASVMILVTDFFVTKLLITLLGYR
jgi:hypothetical protein